jgi:hypothetical protein
MPGGGMAGSFKSMVWDYYLPTDMHEASYFIAITAINAVQVVFSLNVSGLIASSAHKKSMQTVLPAMVCFGVSIITYLILGIKNLILYKAGSMDMQQLSGGMLYEAVLILVFMLYTAFCYKIFYIATAGFLIIFFATYIGMGAMNGTALYIFWVNHFSRGIATT